MEKIHFFVPNKMFLNNYSKMLPYLSKYFLDKKIYFASCGKASLYHILKSYVLKGERILVPYYICESVISTVIQSGNVPVFCDIDIKDLNISIESAKRIFQKLKFRAVIVPSLYGNPANLTEFEKFCLDNNIIMIDDAAQSYGAKLSNNYVGNFGDGGFFSISPGKPLTGYFGSYFWTKSSYNIKYKKNIITHLILLIDFIYNRRFINITYLFPLNIFGRVMRKLAYIKRGKNNYFYEGLLKIDHKFIAGAICAFEDGPFNYKKKFWIEFKEQFQFNNQFTIIENVRGEAIYTKVVLKFNSSKDCILFKEYLTYYKIAYFGGYKPLYVNFNSYKNINDKIIELPIDPNPKKREYLLNTIKKYFNDN